VSPTITRDEHTRYRVLVNRHFTEQGTTPRFGVVYLVAALHAALNQCEEEWVLPAADQRWSSLTVAVRALVSALTDHDARLPQ